MSNLLIKTAIRSLFVLTSRNRAEQQAQRILENYMKLAEGLSQENGSRSIEVPPMRGVDEDMRMWSFYMILEHNKIVNRSISATVQQLLTKPKTEVSSIHLEPFGWMPALWWSSSMTRRPTM